MSAPLIQSASSLAGSTIEVVFDQAMLVNSNLLDPANYTISPEPPGLSSDRSVQAVSSTRIRITLPTDLLAGGAYTVAASDVYSKLGELVSPAATAPFVGIGTRPSFVSAVALDKSTVRVTFDEPMNHSRLTDVQGWSITSLTTGKMLVVSSAAAIDSGDGFFRAVDLKLGSKMKNGGDHQVAGIGQRDAAGNLQKTGDVAEFEGIADLPRMTDASLDASNSKLLVLSFDTTLDPAFATSLSAYRVVSPQFLPRVYIGSLALSEDRKSVKLGISEAKQGETYAVQAASSVVDSSGNVLLPAFSYRFFTGVGQAPTLVRWSRVGKNRVDVYFSEAMLDGVEIRNPARYAFDNGASTVSVLAVEGNLVKLAVTDITAGVLYTLTIE